MQLEADILKAQSDQTQLAKELGVPYFEPQLA